MKYFGYTDDAFSYQQNTEKYLGLSLRFMHLKISISIENLHSFGSFGVLV